MKRIAENKEKRIYEKELEYILGTICDGIKQEVSYRQSKMLQLPKQSRKYLCLSEERERGLCFVMAFYLRTTGCYLVQMENWFCDEDKEMENKIPDLVIWLPKIKNYFFLEVKQIWPGIKQREAIVKVGYDFKKLSKAKNEQNQYCGVLTFGLATDIEERNKLRSLYKHIECRNFKSIKMRTVIFNKMDGSKINSAVLGLWFRTS